MKKKAETKEGGRQTETDRSIDRQRGRQVGRDRQTDRMTGEAGMQTDSQGGRQMK